MDSYKNRHIFITEATYLLFQWLCSSKHVKSTHLPTDYILNCSISVSQEMSLNLSILHHSALSLLETQFSGSDLSLVYVFLCISFSVYTFVYICFQNFTVLHHRTLCCQDSENI